MNQTLALCASHSPGMNHPDHRDAGPRFRDSLFTAAARVKEFAPGVVVLFGSDHRRAFREIIPTFCTVLDATALGDYGSPTGSYRVPREEALALSQGLVAGGIDVAVGTGLVLDHGFSQTAEQILGSIDETPVIPVFINCATAPFPTVSRTLEFGRAIGAHFAETSQRVLYLASGGLSHTPPTLDEATRLITDEKRADLMRANAEQATKLVYENWDLTLLEALGSSKSEVLATVTDQFLVDGGTGAHEVRNWLAAWAADGFRPMDTIGYESVPAWFTGMGVAATRTS